MKSRKGKLVWIIIAVLIIILSIRAFLVVTSNRIAQIPLMSFDEMISYTTKDNEDAIITVGIIKDGEAIYTVYGNNASVLPSEEHTYEIGSITKTFTASLVSKAISEGEIDLYDQINKYIDLPENEYYPNLKRLVTHTSGYKGYYFDKQMVSNFLHHQENDFYCISNERVIKKLEKIKLDNKDYKFKYSNYGMAVVGKVLSNVYSTEYTQLMNNFIANDLKLENTRIADGTGNLSGYWNWKSDDAYIPTGALTSTISDMLKYTELQISGDIPYISNTHEVVAEVNATTKQNEKMNIRMDGVGIGWMIDSKNNIIWHNGGTSNFNSYVAFDKDKQVGVVILSNCSPNYRIPATVMGAKLMMLLQDEVNSKKSILILYLSHTINSIA